MAYYVVFQGPMTSTIGDFWRMVWQTYCGKIVMLTNLKEKNKVRKMKIYSIDNLSYQNNFLLTLILQ